MKCASPRTAGQIAAAVVGLIVAASATAAAQDYTVQTKTDGGTAMTYVSRNAIRKTEPGSRVDVIYRLAEGKIIYIDHTKKAYAEVALEEARQSNVKMAAGMSPQQ